MSVRVGQRPSGVAVGAGSVWVANAVDNTVSAIDQNDVQVRTFSAGTGPTGIAVTSSAVWVTSAGDNTVWKLDPSTGYRLTAPIPVGKDPTAVAVGPSGVWVANYLDDTVSRLDPKTGRVLHTVPVGAGPAGIAVTDTAVWVTAEYAGQVIKIDPGTNQVTRRVAVAGAPRGIAALGDRLWLASGPSYLGHRGGQLRVHAVDIDNLDPASFLSDDAATLLRGTSDGLVTYAHVSGVAGDALVPDLADDPLPQPTGIDDLFHLRPGIRYSNGAPLRAGDVRYSIERHFRAWARDPGFINPFLADIVGGAACRRRPATCDLSQGIQTDDEARTVRIRLTRPNPQFLRALATSDAFIVPAGTPLTRGPVPGTGPYKVTRFVPGDRVELQRNPYFRQWSRAAQPDGYPDTIVGDIGTATAATVRQVEQGQLDFVPSGDMADLPASVVQHAALGRRLRLYDAPAFQTGIAILNTRLPPFNDLRVRKALNYAVDRDELIRRRRAGHLLNARPTCQVLDPGMGGYRPYCPYTVNPSSSGRWVGPDLATAQRLVKESGTAGQEVTVWEPSSPYDPDGAYFVDLLTKLGYKARLHTPRPDFVRSYVPTLTTGRVQLSVLIWGNASADDAIVPLLCKSFDAKRRNFQPNYGGFCNEQIDTEYHHLLQLEVSDRAAANARWAKLDRQLVDAAPWVPVWTGWAPALASNRVGNYTPHTALGVLLDQLWVQ